MFQIFVYGSLMPGQRAYHLCAEHVLSATPAIAQGRLYQLIFGYPAMTVKEPGEEVWEKAGQESGEKAEAVNGVILSFINPLILQILDNYEQHDPATFASYLPNLLLADHQYSRVKIEVFSATATQTPLGIAWSYVMTPQQIQQLGGVHLPDGRWHP